MKIIIDTSSKRVASSSSTRQRKEKKRIKKSHINMNVRDFVKRVNLDSESPHGIPLTPHNTTQFLASCNPASNCGHPSQNNIFGSMLGKNIFKKIFLCIYRN